MKILKASAGSGKTYSLAKEYISLLLGSPSPDQYRHILAVTFTNKATAEMKSRILSELKTLADNPQKSPYFKDFVPSVFPDPDRLKNKSKAVLSRILHDYSQMGVSTIDRFFQQTLRAFAREVGQYTAYQVELDRDALVEEAVTRVLDSLSEQKDPALLEWIIRGVKDDLEREGRFTLDRRLREMGNALPEMPGGGRKALDKDRLEELSAACRKTVAAFTQKVKDGAQAVADALAACGINPAESNRGFLKGIYPYAELSVRDYIMAPTPAFQEKALDLEKWFAKTKMHLAAAAVPAAGAMADFIALFGDEYKAYCTAQTIRGQLYGLGVAAELRKALTAVQKEKGVISIEDTNDILHGIISGSDAPFIYEKTGTRYENYLLDEFQDTSRVQWENFLPLLQNSEAEGKESLCVGDVKQSIYRWRGSDWNLLGSEVQKTFGLDDSRIGVLGGNYRTCREIVGFNNGFFSYAAAEVDRICGREAAEDGSVSSLYGDVEQKPCTKDGAAGFVHVLFTEKAEDETVAMMDSIRAVRSRGARWEDIAILVRGNAEGEAIAQLLVENGIPVVSDDALYVKGSVTARRLVSMLSLIENPALEGGRSVAAFLAKEMGVSAAEESVYHSLVNLAEKLLADIRAYDEQTYDAEIPYIAAFVDFLRDWSSRNGENLGAFLRDWKESNPKIPSPPQGDAVRVMTIHKSKGLEFPVVILPFTEKVTLFKPTSQWCRVDGLEEYFRVNLSEASLNTAFGDDYVRERTGQGVDGLNVLYVAMTRAKCELHVIAAMPPKSFMEAAEKGAALPAKNFSQILYGFIREKKMTAGAPYDFTQMKRDETSHTGVTIGFPCAKNSVAGRLSLGGDEPKEKNVDEPETTLF